MMYFKVDNMQTGKSRILLQDIDGRYTVYCLFGAFEGAKPISETEARVTAEFIATACNSYYDLLKACITVTERKPLSGKAEDVRLSESDLALVEKAIEKAERFGIN